MKTLFKIDTKYQICIIDLVKLPETTTKNCYWMFEAYAFSDKYSQAYKTFTLIPNNSFLNLFWTTSSSNSQTT